MSCTCRDDEHGNRVMCRIHYHRMRGRVYLQEWEVWGWPDYRDNWERPAADEMRFWFMRASFG